MILVMVSHNFCFVMIRCRGVHCHIDMLMCYAVLQYNIIIQCACVFPYNYDSSTSYLATWEFATNAGLLRKHRHHNYIHFHWNAAFSFRYCSQMPLWCIRWFIECMRLDRNGSRRWMLNFCCIHIKMMLAILRNDAIGVFEKHLDHTDSVSIFYTRSTFHFKWNAAFALQHCVAVRSVLCICWIYASCFEHTSVFTQSNTQHHQDMYPAKVQHSPSPTVSFKSSTHRVGFYLTRQGS